MNFNGTQVTDAGLNELGGLKSLQDLYLRDTQVTGTGFNPELRYEGEYRQETAHVVSGSRFGVG